MENNLPISIKGVVIENNCVWLRKNPRNEWELPGGRLEAGEQPELTIVRELREELGINSEVSDIVHSGVLSIKIADKTKDVFIVSYRCTPLKRVGDFEFLGEDGEAEFKLVPLHELDLLSIPKIYRDAIEKAFQASS